MKIDYNYCYFVLKSVDIYYIFNYLLQIKINYIRIKSCQ